MPVWGMGYPLSPRQFEGHSTCMKVLGVELDSLALQAHLPGEKFDRIVALMETWSAKKHCTCKDLESLIRNLQHACKVILGVVHFFGV